VSPFADAAARIAVFMAGAILVYITLMSAIKTFVLPRSVNTLITRVVFGSILRLFTWRQRRMTTYEQRDRHMALFAPIALLALPVVWLVLVLIGYMLMYYAVGVGTLLDAFRISGSSLFTLGFAMDARTQSLVLEFTQAGLGMILIALLIAYLPTMYSAFAKREALVNLLDVRAGTPPSPVTLIIRLHGINGLERLGGLWREWEQWFVDVEESHTTFMLLVFFRSPHGTRSWITAAGTILDTASMANAVLDIPREPQADLTIRAGFVALREIAEFFGFAFDPDPAPTDPISITKEEFLSAVDELRAAGVPLKQDMEQAWRDYAGWRVNYDTVLLDLARLTMAPYAQWISDRSLPARIKHHASARAKRAARPPSSS
jgi:hypothetical protein